VLLGQPASFDCRVSQLPREQDVVDYFRWRNEDAARNALHSHCYWLLRGRGDTAQEATARLAGMSVADRNELLFANGINFNELPSWQKRGVGLYWEPYAKSGVNPVTGRTETASRRAIRRDLELPMKDAYSDYVRRLLRPEAAPEH
jgi:tRNA(His) 5'-end guanylyltransferase